jgi:hypothetical protein
MGGAVAPPRSTRRRFLKVAGAASLSAAIVPSLAQLARGATASRDSTAAKAPPPTTPPANEPSEFADDVRAMKDVIRRRYGKHLDAKQIDAIGEEMDGRMKGGKTMRAVKLANFEEPDATFHA